MDKFMECQNAIESPGCLMAISTSLFATTDVLHHRHMGIWLRRVFVLFVVPKIPGSTPC
jgi:hypothetical protein